MNSQLMESAIQGLMILGRTREEAIAEILANDRKRELERDDEMSIGKATYS